MWNKVMLATAALVATVNFANGLFMLISPAGWYFAVPGVTTTGPFNQHFIRDIGFIFLFIGAAFVMGALRPSYRLLLWSAATLWLWAHALFHVWEVMVGLCGPSALLRDFAAVSLPAILGTILSLWADRHQASEARASRFDHISDKEIVQ